jgi:hypothetical protein
MRLSEESQQERTMRRLYACTQTLLSIADELVDPVDIDERGDLLIAAENLIDIAVHVTESVRDIAWQHSMTPSEIERDSQEDY